MIRICALSVLVALAAGAAQPQHYGGASDPRTAAILSEQRYLTGDGTFGTQYKQEDGVEFKEESDAYGNRKGSYSYVDAGGKKHTVSYTAGKDGFQASGDGIPQAAAQPQYKPLPQYNPPDQYYNRQQQQQQQQQQPQQDYYRDDYQGQQQYQPQYHSQQQQQQQPQYRPQSQYQPQQQPQYRPQPQYQPQQYQPRYDPTTEPPHRFYPPGKLSLQRSPDGFAYSFNKN